MIFVVGDAPGAKEERGFVGVGEVPGGGEGLRVDLEHVGDGDGESVDQEVVAHFEFERRVIIIILLGGRIVK